MNIDSIKDGIVIDHITAGKGMEIYKLLGLDSLDCSVALIKNVASRKMGKKDIIKIDSDFDVDTDILGFVDQMLEKYNCPMKTQMAICVAIEEVFVNIARYAYEDGNGEVTLGIKLDEENQIITFKMSDRGIPFDPLKKDDPDITLSADEREIGGLGIFITKKTMDSISYAYENGENVLTMLKKI